MNIDTTQVSTNGDREKFIHDEVLMMVILGTLGRNPTYNERATDAQKEQFRKKLKGQLDKFGKKYEQCSVDEEEHVENIRSLADTMSNEHDSILKGKRFRIGSAQKALNLYLKYLWCLGKIDIPPHCPIDGVILRDKLKCDDKWTDLDCIERYRHIIKKTKEMAGSFPLARWELDVFNKER